MRIRNIIELCHFLFSGAQWTKYVEKKRDKRKTLQIRQEMQPLAAED